MAAKPKEKRYFTFTLIYAIPLFFIIYFIERLTQLVGFYDEPWVVILVSVIALTIGLTIANYYFGSKQESFNSYKLTWYLFGFYILIRTIFKVIVGLSNGTFAWWGTVIPLFGLVELIPPILIPIIIGFLKKKKH